MKINEYDVDLLLEAVRRLNEQSDETKKLLAQAAEKNRVAQLAAVRTKQLSDEVQEYTGSLHLRRAFVDWANDAMLTGDSQTKTKATAVRNLLTRTDRG